MSEGLIVSMIRTIIWGNGSQARLLHRIITDQQLGTVTAFVDLYDTGNVFDTEAMIATDVDSIISALHGVDQFVVAIGSHYGAARLELFNLLSRLGKKPLDVVHSSAMIQPTANVEPGVVAMPGASVGYFSHIGKSCVLNTGCSVDHECSIGDGVHIMGAATVTGRVSIGSYATIGSNATILPDIKVGIGAYVGAGAVITKDVADWSVVAGVPGRYLKPNTVGIDLKTTSIVNDILAEVHLTRG